MDAAARLVYSRPTLMAANTYSDQWFSTFLHPIPAEQTAREVEFLARQFPLPAYSRLLDVCCGPGRHVVPLAKLGYDVVGLDNHEGAIRAAERHALEVRANFILGDQRTQQLPASSQHGIYVLWQSFGYYSPMENRRLLQQWCSLLKPAGRLVLDVYNRRFFEGKDGRRMAKVPGGNIVETKKLRGKQLTVHLEYPGFARDEFQWEIFTPEELEALASECGFSPILRCSRFTEAELPSEFEPRMQLVFQKAEVI